VTLKAELQALPRFKSAKPTPQEVEKMCFEFRNILAKLSKGSMSDQDQVLHLIFKLQPEHLTRFRNDPMYCNRLNTLEGIMQCLRDAADTDQMTYVIDQQYRQQERTGKGKLLTTQETPTPPSVQDRKCYKCGEKGHIARECPQKKRDELANMRVSMKCAFCGKKGHVAVKCFTNPANPDNKLAEIAERKRARQKEQAQKEKEKEKQKEKEKDKDNSQKKKSPEGFDSGVETRGQKRQRLLQMLQELCVDDK
jgi:transcription elongation factor Elf1